MSFGVKGKPKNSLEDIFGDKTTQKEKATAEVKEANASVVKVFDDPLGSEAVTVKADPKKSDVARVPASPVSQPQGLLCPVCHFSFYQKKLVFCSDLQPNLFIMNCSFRVKF